MGHLAAAVGVVVAGENGMRTGCIAIAGWLNVVIDHGLLVRIFAGARNMTQFLYTGQAFSLRGLEGSCGRISRTGTR